MTQASTAHVDHCSPTMGTGYVAELEKAQGFSVLHTLSLPPVLPPAAHTGKPPTTGLVDNGRAGNTHASKTRDGQASVGETDAHTIGTGQAPTGSTRRVPQPPDTGHHNPITSHYKHVGCTAQTRTTLGKKLRVVVDIASGRRPIDSLLAFPMSNAVRSTIRNLARAGSIKGASLRSFHPNPAATVNCVDFVGTIQVENRVRAFSGRFKNNKKAASWKLDTFQLV